MNIAVTGATGFIGRCISERFADSHNILASGRNLEAGAQLKSKGISFCQADLLDIESLENSIAGADIVIHCAALAGDWGKYSDFYQTNVVGTNNLITACQELSIQKIIFISTPSIYFDGKERLDITEDDPLPKKQLTAYGKTKLEAERTLFAARQHDIHTISFRPRAVYGPYDQTIIPRILRMAEKGKIPLINNGKALVDITYIDNLIDAIESALAAPESAWNQAYNISNGEPITLRQWFKLILDAFDVEFQTKNLPIPLAKTLAFIMETASRLPFGLRRPLMTRFSVGYMGRSLTMSIEKAKDLLDYNPRVSNEEGFALYKNWHKETHQ